MASEPRVVEIWVARILVIEVNTVELVCAASLCYLLSPLVSTPVRKLSKTSCIVVTEETEVNLDTLLAEWLEINF